MSCHYLPPAKCALASAVFVDFGLDIAERENLFRAEGVEVETSKKKQQGWNESENLIRVARQDFGFALPEDLRGFDLASPETPNKIQQEVLGLRHVGGI
jgi:hypothetical protein